VRYKGPAPLQRKREAEQVARGGDQIKKAALTTILYQRLRSLGHDMSRKEAAPRVPRMLQD